MAKKRIQYSFDPAGNRSAMVDPDGGRFTYAYDSLNRIAHLENPQNERTSYGYDAAGRRTLKKLANGTRASFSYDAASNLTRLANLKSDGTTISSFHYRYDKSSNRTAVLEADGSRVTWSYDATYQLTGEHRTGTSAYRNTFTYDPAGNRTLKNEDMARTTYAYDAANQLTTSQDLTGTTTYTFDDNGNQQIVEPPTGNRTTTTWDHENRTTLVELPSGVRNTMAYEPDGLRVKLEESSGTKKFIWDDQNYLAETDASDLTQVVYTNEPAYYGNLISQRRGATTNWYHFDAIGSTRELTLASQAVSDSYLYDAVGTVVDKNGTTNISFQFGGALGYYLATDQDTFYIRARFYEPRIARWLTLDPLGLVDGLNMFLFVSNNPVALIDPSGTQMDFECNATCLEANDNAGKGPVVHAGPRTGELFNAILGNAHYKDPSTGASVDNSVASQMLANFGFRNPKWFENWYEELPKRDGCPPSDPCRCCCTKVNWASVLTETIEGDKEAIMFLTQTKRPPSGVPHVDKDLPFPLGKAFNPCTDRVADPRFSFHDTPGEAAIYTFLAKGGTLFSQAFSTCVYCTEGPERFDETIPYMVTYCCVDWGHSITRQNGNRPRIKRWVNKQTQEWDYYEDWKNEGTRIVRVPVGDCVEPSDGFKDAIKNLRYWKQPKT